MTEEVFISYSYDSEEHIDRVLALSNRLRSEGVDCVLDQYEESPPEGWPRWMDRKIRTAKYVLVVCTPLYLKRVMGEEDPGKGLGVKWEGGVIYQHLYNAGMEGQKFIPVVFDPADQTAIPTPLQAFTFYNLADPARYERLYLRLTDQPYVQKPELGKKRPLPSKPVKTNPKLFLTSPIDIELWNAAKWRATFFMVAPDIPPVLGVAFLNAEPAREIFQKWHERYGDRDLYEEVRVSIIEGPLPGQEDGYTVHIGPDLDGAVARYKDAGLEVGDDLFMCISRFNRMTPPATSRNLENFKAAYYHHKTYYLAPGVISEDQKELKPLLDLGIYKNKVTFKAVRDIGEHDQDRVVLREASAELGSES